MQVDIRSNLREVIIEMQATRKEILPATARALNRAAVTTRATAQREIRATYNLRARTVREQIRLRRANRSNLRAVLTASGRPIPLIEFGARAVRPWNVPGRRPRRGGGVSVKVKAARKFIPGVFIARMRSGHVGVFRRPGPARRPIEHLFSISIPMAFTQRTIAGLMERVARAEFTKNFKRDLAFQLSKRMA